MLEKILPPSRRRSLIAPALLLALVGLYWGGMGLARRSTRLNFEVVAPGRLLRTAQPRPGDLDRIHRTEGIGTIVSLRGGEEPEVKEWAQKHGVALVSMQMKADNPPTDGQIGLFFDIMRGDPVDVEAYRDVITQRGGLQKARVFVFPQPVLLHCEGGSDRTGVMTALYRMAFQGWGVKLAQQDMTGRFHLTSMHPAQFAFLESIAPKINPYYGSRGGRLSLVPPAPAPVPSAPSAPAAAGIP